MEWFYHLKIKLKRQKSLRNQWDNKTKIFTLKMYIIFQKSSFPTYIHAVNTHTHTLKKKKKTAFSLHFSFWRTYINVIHIHNMFKAHDITFCSQWPLHEHFYYYSRDIRANRICSFVQWLFLRCDCPRKQEKYRKLYWFIRKVVRIWK